MLGVGATLQGYASHLGLEEILGSLNASLFGISCDGMRHITQNRLNLTTTLPLDSVVSSNSIETFLLTFYFQALKMPYCSNKPVPTPGHLLPRPKISGPAANTKEQETSLKRKIFDSISDTGDGNIITIWFSMRRHFVENWQIYFQEPDKRRIERQSVIKLE